METNTLPISGHNLSRRQVLSASSVALLAPAALVACGGTSNDAPKVTLYATVSSGAVGASFSLSVDVESDIDIKEVNIYRATSNSEIPLATFNAKPYLTQTIIPAGTAGTTIQYKARAKDSDDQTTDSSSVSITVNA
jgi:hypothetical protein